MNDPKPTGRRDEEFVERLTAALQKGLDASNLEKLKKDIDDAIDDATDRLENYLKDDFAANLAGYVQVMADRAVDALLAGNEDMMRRYLSCEQTGYNPRNSDGLVRHTGALFEYGGLALRRKIVDAHAELLKTERILDLEAQVKKLQELVDRKNIEIYRLQEGLR